MKRTLQAAAGVALMAAGGLAVLALKASTSAMHPAPGAIAWGLADYPDLRPEPVRVVSRTGVTLAGRFFEGTGTGATVVLTHGYGGNQDEVLPVAAALHAAGLNVMTYDSRGCGDSPGEVTFGTLEQQDLRSVVDAVARRPGVAPERIGAFGFSMGAGATILAAAADPRIRAVVADSAWADVLDWLRPSVSDAVLHPRAPFSWASLQLVQLRTPARFARLRPEEVIGRISPRPLLLVHGDQDAVVPPVDADRNYAAAGEPKELLRVAGAAHGDTLRPGGAASGRRVTEFFEQALRD